LFKEHRMRNPIPLAATLASLAILTLIVGTAAAAAQTAAADEAIEPHGGVVQTLALTPAQKNAIYNAVFPQRLRPVGVQLAAAVGAPVPPSVELLALPDEAVAGNPWATLLKYAMVDGDIVVVDPVSMRVVDVLRGRAKP
jgi:hypothetical protein